MKQSIANRHGVRLAIETELNESKAGLAFVVHGLGGFKQQIHIRTMAETCYNAGYSVVTYDAAHTLGESGGNIQLATLSNYFEDLEDVVAWCKTQTWYIEPFVLAGHSLGAASIIMFAAKYPQRVRALVPISAYVAGRLYEQTIDAEVLQEWQARGYLDKPSSSKPGAMKRLGWELIEDGRNHDMRVTALSISAPALLVVGSDDETTPPLIQKQLLESFRGPKALHVIKGMGHNPRSLEQNAELSGIISRWLASIDSGGGVGGKP